ncbi:hypothetical protein AVEN_88105-1 [Araneus ventricosus]|uniref:Uncharacterized protein n=1 Tax=Araneus ventricosus TaxID=182803 RepID=A0A4Y2KTY3_ARAVE|nr:hypothetical protein AVEN_88105-1 [Araneus ventricosus]
MVNIALRGSRSLNFVSIMQRGVTFLLRPIDGIEPRGACDFRGDRSPQSKGSERFWVRLGYITSRFEATRGLFRDGPRNFEPRSDDEDNTSAGTPSPRFRATPAGGRLATTHDLACSRPHTRRIFSGIGFVSNLRPSGPEVETLPLGHRDLREILGEKGARLDFCCSARYLFWYSISR